MAHHNRVFPTCSCRLAAFLLLFFAAMANWAAAEAPPAKEAATQPVAGEADPLLEVIRFGLPPWQKGLSVDEVRDQYKPMLDWLAEQTGRKFIIVGGQSYEGMVEMVAQGRVQIAALSPVPYVQAKKANPQIELIATEIKWNEDKTKTIDSYTGYIVTLKSNANLNTLADLKGKKFGFVNLESSSGYRYPNAILKDNGLEYKSYFEKVFFLGSHPRVTDALVDGSIDAGATWDFNLQQATKKHGEVFKIIVATPPIPNICIAAHPKLPPELRKKIRECLLHIDPKLLKGTSAVGYVDRPDSFYDIVRTLVSNEGSQPRQ